MNKKEFVEKNKGKDKLVGRSIRLNRFELKPKKDYAEFIAWGDVHFGHPQCKEYEAKEMLDWALETKTPIILMGDLIESGLIGSVGDSVYQQKLNPQGQMEAMIDMLQPQADSNLIIGLHSGNHEARITKATGIDISKIMAKLLRVPYLGYACWNLITVGKQKYSCYSQHSSGGSRFKHTKLKKIIDQMAWLRADLLLAGHHHSLDSNRTTIQEIDLRSRTVKEKKCYVVLTGSFIGWDKSYAQAAAFPPCEIGSPKIKLFATKRKIKISL